MSQKKNESNSQVFDLDQSLLKDLLFDEPEGESVDDLEDEIDEEIKKTKKKTPKQKTESDENKSKRKKVLNEDQLTELKDAFLSFQSKVTDQQQMIADLQNQIETLRSTTPSDTITISLGRVVSTISINSLRDLIQNLESLNIQNKPLRQIYQTKLIELGKNLKTASYSEREMYEIYFQSSMPKNPSIAQISAQGGISIANFQQHLHHRLVELGKKHGIPDIIQEVTEITDEEGNTYTNESHPIYIIKDIRNDIDGEMTRIRNILYQGFKDRTYFAEKEKVVNKKTEIVYINNQKWFAQNLPLIDFYNQHLTLLLSEITNSVLNHHLDHLFNSPDPITLESIKEYLRQSLFTLD